MATRQSKEDILAGLELALNEILNVKSLDHWISVKDRPISKILEDAGVDKKYNSPVMESLVKVGLIEEEGERAGKIYKIKSTVIPDVKYLANRCYAINKENIDRYNGRTEGYPSAQTSSELKPKRHYANRKSPEEKSHNPNTQKLGKKMRPVNLPNLGSKRFIIEEMSVLECRVVGMYLDKTSVEKDKVVYELETPKGLYDNINLLDLFETSDEAIQKIIKNVQIIKL